MKQFYITSETFRLQGDDPTVPDAYVDPAELAKLKKLAGIDSLGIMERHLAEKAANKFTNADGQDSLISGMTGTEKAEYQRKHNIQPGTDAWFKLWYARPGLTGEKNV